MIVRRSNFTKVCLCARLNLNLFKKEPTKEVGQEEASFPKLQKGNQALSKRAFES